MGPHALQDIVERSHGMLDMSHRTSLPGRELAIRQFPVAAISGFVDVDAITLSSAQLAAAGRIDPATTWRIILLAALTNLVFKVGAVLVLGTRKLFWRQALAFGVSIAGGVVMLAGWF